MPAAHKHAEYIIGWAQGKIVQEQTVVGEWVTLPHPGQHPVDWHENARLRFKPQTHSKFMSVSLTSDGELRIGHVADTPMMAYVPLAHKMMQLEFDPSTGKIMVYMNEIIQQEP